MKKALALLVCVLAFGCGSSIKKFSTEELDAMKTKVTVGMSFDEVIDAIGSPEADNYSPEERNGFISYLGENRNELLNIMFMDGKVTEIRRLQAQP